MKLLDGKGWSRASCRNITDDNRCFRCGNPDVRAMNSRKHMTVSTEAGQAFSLKNKVKYRNCLMPDLTLAALSLVYLKL